MGMEMSVDNCILLVVNQYIQSYTNLPFSVSPQRAIVLLYTFSELAYLPQLQKALPISSIILQSSKSYFTAWSQHCSASRCLLPSGAERRHTRLKYPQTTGDELFSILASQRASSASSRSFSLKQAIPAPSQEVEVGESLKKCYQEMYDISKSLDEVERWIYIYIYIIYIYI